MLCPEADVSDADDEREARLHGLPVRVLRLLRAEDLPRSVLGPGGAAFVDALLAHAADPLPPMPPLDDARVQRVVMVAALGSAHPREHVGTLLAKGVPVDIRDGAGRTPLIHAASRGLQEVVAALLDRGAAVDACGADGRTALWWAADLGRSGREPTADNRAYLGTVELLLAADADANRADADGVTPLVCAVRRDAVGIATMLRSQGADPAPARRFATSVSMKAALH
jgi:hypothetical protein